eukprot:CAMPEP_0119037696 /NCGR_PEP_ID=MMETSP1177-20130426/6192_1 /TAXON_ID=2985 /ORGANISM="Ochromonas sp, Strain CCMP1899" /LENGTH=198 /DNA_ID=CAMNT_0006999313 /DNA_START=108 /DNA_END=701 /DNA_ORIENTATION=-
MAKKTLDRSILDAPRIAYGDNLTEEEKGEKTRMIMPDYLKFNFIQKLMPKAIYDRCRRAFLFAPDDPNNLHQVLPQRHTLGLNVDRIKGYRYPAPGSRHGALIPIRESSDELYATTQMISDNRNLQQNYVISINASDPTILIADIETEKKEGSPGNKNPAVLAYDSTGLRSTMSATWSELDKAVAANATPDHLPAPEW